MTIYVDAAAIEEPTLKLIECHCGHYIEWTEARAEWKAQGRKLLCDKKECQP